MSLHRYTRVHYYEVGNRGLKSMTILNPSSKESGYAGTYKKGNIHVRSAFYKSIDLVIRNTPVYKESGLITTSFELPVPFSTRANEEQPRHVIFQKMPLFILIFFIHFSIRIFSEKSIQEHKNKNYRKDSSYSKMTCRKKIA